MTTINNHPIEMLQEVLPAYGFDKGAVSVEAFGSGLINSTWKINSGGKEYVLQRVNDSVFKEPANIAHNLKLIGRFLSVHHPEYLFVGTISTNKGEELEHIKGNGYYRLFPFISGSHSKDVVETPQQAKEAAKQFGKFTRLLHGVDISQLKVTIPFFHDLSLRYEQFLKAIELGDRVRNEEAADLVAALISHADIVREFKNITVNPAFKLRVTHHDTKISNVLFDKNGKGLCVIDLDTVMPGYFISDVGDMMRTYLSPVSEEETDFSRIEIRDEFYKAIVEGYYGEMKNELTAPEKKYFFYAGTFMIYMQAVRFVTDYLNNDSYYGAKYPAHNFMRGKNQLVLLEKLLQKKERLESIVNLS